MLLYPITNLCGDTRSRTLFAEGYCLTKQNMDWFTDHYLAGSGIERPTRACRRCWPTTCPGCRPRWC